MADTNEESAFNDVENSLLGRLYKSDSGDYVYRFGALKITGNENQWEVYNLTTNCRDSILLSELPKLKIIPKNDLTEEESKNLEKLLRQPPEE